MSGLDTLRLVAPVIIALLGFAAAGRFVEGVLVALGAYIVLFGADQPGRRRLKTFLLAAVLMLVSISCGMVVAGSFVSTLLAYLAVAAVAVGGDVVFPLGAPGPFFFVLMVGGGTLLGPTGLDLAAVLPFVALGNVLAIAFGMGDLLRDRYGSERRAVATAGEAVASLRAAVTSPTADTDVVDEQLAAAASTVYHAWGAP